MATTEQVIQPDYNDKTIYEGVWVLDLGDETTAKESEHLVKIVGGEANEDGSDACFDCELLYLPIEWPKAPSPQWMMENVNPSMLRRPVAGDWVLEQARNASIDSWFAAKDGVEKAMNNERVAGKTMNDIENLINRLEAEAEGFVEP
jgi:hypothetical protein